MAEYALFDLHVRLLTPVHIGSGRELLNQYDYAVHRGRTWRLNEDALLDAQNVQDLELAARIARLPPATLLDPKRDFVSDNGLFRYVLRGAPRSSAAGASVREQLKDLYDRPYLPGTSLKGALRTALAWVGWGELGLRPDRRELVPNPRFAARNYERRILGRDPNHDLLRALHVGDSAPVEAENLILVNAQVLHQSGALGSPIELEAIRPETAFRLPLKIDLALFSAWAGRNRLQHANWLRDLPAVVRRHTAQRLDQEVSWFGPVGNARLIADLYRQLKSVRLPNRAFLLQVGWGTGWDDKTFGSHLREDEAFMEGILAPRRSGGYGIARGTADRAIPFPKVDAYWSTQEDDRSLPWDGWSSRWSRGRQTRL